MLPRRVLKGISPTERLYGVRPDHRSLKTFACLCFPHLRQYNINKLDFRSKPCTFLGYPVNQKEYKCLDSDGRIFVSIHFVFDEHVFRFSNPDMKITKKIYNPKMSIPILPVYSDVNQQKESERTAGSHDSQLTMPDQSSHEPADVSNYLNHSPKGRYSNQSLVRQEFHEIQRRSESDHLQPCQ